MTETTPIAYDEIYQAVKYLFISVVCASTALACSGCTGPFGIVVGGEDIQDAYNRRVALETGEPLGRYTDEEKKALNNIVARRY